MTAIRTISGEIDMSQAGMSQVDMERAGVGQGAVAQAGIGLPPDVLPGLLAEVARLTTSEAAVAIARRFGNRRMYLPLDPPDRHPLVELLGRDSAVRICARFGGDQVTWPSARAFLRWHDARALRAGGASVARIAAALDINERHARRLVAGVVKGAARDAGMRDVAAREGGLASKGDRVARQAGGGLG